VVAGIVETVGVAEMVEAVVDTEIAAVVVAVEMEKLF